MKKKNHNTAPYNLKPFVQSKDLAPVCEIILGRPLIFLNFSKKNQNILKR